MLDDKDEFTKETRRGLPHPHNKGTRYPTTDGRSVYAKGTYWAHNTKDLPPCNPELQGEVELPICRECMEKCNQCRTKSKKDPARKKLVETIREMERANELNDRKKQ